jgi:hypothetical protein
MLAMGAGANSVEYVRKQLNVAKFILSEMMEAREMVLVSSDGKEIA